jgi:hypothetical protein
MLRVARALQLDGGKLLDAHLAEDPRDLTA